jgi:HEAT repeat protein/nitrate/nitrite transporter NarK
MGVGALGMAWFALALGMPLTMFMERLGARDVTIGMVVTVQWLAMVMQIPSALVAERLTNRKLYWGTLSTLHRLLWFLPPLVPLVFPNGASAGWAMLALVGVSSLLANASSAPWFSWMADLIPEHQRNRFWARRQSLTQGAFLVAMGLGGWILDRYSGSGGTEASFTGFRIVFILAGLAGTADILIHLLVPEPKPHPVTRGEPWHQRLRKPFADPDFLWLTLAFGAWSFGLGLVGSFGFLYLKRQFHATYSQLAAFTVCAALGTVVASPLWGKVMDHVGERTFALAMFALAPLFGLQWFFLSAGNVSLLGGAEVPVAVVIVCAVALFSGAFYTGAPLAQLVLISAVTRKEGRTLAMAVHWTLVGLVGASGPAVGGWIMDLTAKHPLAWHLPTGTPLAGFHLLVLAHMLVSWLVAVPLLARTRPRHGNLPVQALAGNPLRVAGLIHNLVTLGEASSWRDRARAVRDLGRKRSSHVVGELIEKLNDPSAAVREEAVQALGRIGSPTAVDALLQRLEDPESDLSVHIARALREARDPRSVDALMRNLDSPDSEIRKESARSLGAIGDQRAAGTLLELVRQSEDMPLVTASSEALARLGQVAAIHQILRRMKDARNPALRTSLAVAVADLLGTPGEFYPILMGERREVGSELAAMLKAIRIRTRRAAGRPLRDDANQLRGLTEQIEEATLGGDLPRAARTLFDLALGMATLRREVNRGPDAEALIENLVWRDPHFGIGLSYLNTLRETPPTETASSLQDTDILIGAYFLLHWVKTWRNQPADLPPPGSD